MNRTGAMLALAGCLISATASAQSFNYWPAAAVVGDRTMYVPMGTPLTLMTRTQVSTKDNKSGDRIYFTVAETMSFRGQVVIPAGAVAVGEVARSDRNGHLGKKGKIDINLLYVETPNGPVRLSGGAANRGTSGVIPSVATIVFVSWLGYFIHGTSAHIPPNLPVQAYLAEDMHFAMGKPAPAVAATAVQPDAVRTLPASFDDAHRPRVVQTAQR
ncbi:hypothetical protein [uncultured Sphingomonas sp.]|uniref:hypothetical protein n=1 Tax=uncultured Sphingomonas sp. TaxID=158754 RepID=UPI0035C994C7